MRHQYNFQSSWGYTNCSICDADRLCNEWLRDDGLVVWLCSACENTLHL
jgi:hypothetical protein